MPLRSNPCIACPVVQHAIVQQPMYSTPVLQRAIPHDSIYAACHGAAAQLHSLLDLQHAAAQHAVCMTCWLCSMLVVQGHFDCAAALWLPVNRVV